MPLLRTPSEPFLHGSSERGTFLRKSMIEVRNECCHYAQEGDDIFGGFNEQFDL